MLVVLNQVYSTSQAHGEIYNTEEYDMSKIHSIAPSCGFKSLSMIDDRCYAVYLARLTIVIYGVTGMTRT